MQLKTIEEQPYNAETPLAALGAAPTPNDLFYVRSNFDIPQIDAQSWRLNIGGLVSRPHSYTLDELYTFDLVEETVTLECAGNGRLLMNPFPGGTAWGLGAVSAARFRGVRLAEVLRRAEPADEVLNWLFTGADGGVVEPEGDINYQFALANDLASDSSPLLAIEMNGEPLPLEHGYPVRLVVPGSYGMRSVKWLTSITAMDEPFVGHFPLKYRYFGDRLAEDGEPVGAMRTRSLVVEPADGAPVEGGVVTVRGIAWSGQGTVDSVEVSVDGGSWVSPNVGLPAGEFALTPWTLTVSHLSPGKHRVRCRAADTSGAIQPLEPEWNANGYGNNVVHEISLDMS